MKMKLFRSICLALVALAIVKVSTRAASVLDDITVSPFAAIRTENFDGASTLGGGLDVGYSINKFVSIHGTALGFEEYTCGSGAIDESEFFAKARFVSYAKEKFSLYGKGGAVRDWNDEQWATSVGLGADLRLSKHVSLGADYSIRAWFYERDKDSLIRALVNISF